MGQYRGEEEDGWVNAGEWREAGEVLTGEGKAWEDGMLEGVQISQKADGVREAAFDK